MSSSERYIRHRFPIKVVEDCVWLYFRFSLSHHMGQIQPELCHNFNEVSKAELVPRIPADTQNDNLSVKVQPSKQMLVPTQLAHSVVLGSLKRPLCLVAAAVCTRSLGTS
jgi:hypothetical protein